MNNEHPVLVKLRAQLAQKKAQPTWAELCEKIKRNIETRAAEQAAQEKNDKGGE